MAAVGAAAAAASPETARCPVVTAEADMIDARSAQAERSDCSKRAEEAAVAVPLMVAVEEAAVAVLLLPSGWTKTSQWLRGQMVQAHH
jgi:hypothetical protein